MIYTITPENIHRKVVQAMTGRANLATLRASRPGSQLWLDIRRCDDGRFILYRERMFSGSTNTDGAVGDIGDFEYAKSYIIVLLEKFFG